MKQSTSKKPLHLSLHTLIVSLTFSGTVVRTMFFAFFAIAATVLAFLGSDAEIVEEAFGGSLNMMLTYILNSSFFVAAFAFFDAAYVTVSRALPWNRKGDMLILGVVELFILANIFLPVILPISGLVPFNVFWLPVVPLFIISVRILLGLLFSLPLRK